MSAFTITGIPAFSDNYIWLVDDGERAVAVDPGDASVVMQRLESTGLTLDAVLITHHHPDHTGGLATLVDAYPELRIIGPKNPGIKLVNQRVAEGDRVEVLGSLELEVIDVPGHTLDHIAFFASPDAQSPKLANLDEPVLFCGDTLFAGGCGRLFEGSAAQMHNSLSKLAQLDERTKVYCAHEYTLANLKFALAVEPENQALQHRFEDVTAKRENNQPTVPSSLQLELDTNPFLRSGAPAIWETLKHQGHNVSDDVSAFALVRNWKDNF